MLDQSIAGSDSPTDEPPQSLVGHVVPLSDIVVARLRKALAANGQRIHIEMLGKTPWGGDHWIEHCAVGWREALRFIRAERARGFAVRSLCDNDAYNAATGRDA